MDENGFIPDDRRATLHRVVLYLRRKYEGVFGQETIEAIVFDSYRQMAAKAKITEWLVATAEKLTKDRLEALLRAEGRSPTTCRRSSSFASTMPAGHRWPSAGSGTSAATGSRASPAGPSRRPR